MLPAAIIGVYKHFPERATPVANIQQGDSARNGVAGNGYPEIAIPLLVKFPNVFKIGLLLNSDGNIEFVRLDMQYMVNDRLLFAQSHHGHSRRHSITTGPEYRPV